MASLDPKLNINYDANYAKGKVPALKTIVAGYVACKIREQSSLGGTLKKIYMPCELYNSSWKIFIKNKVDNQYLVFGYGPEFENYLSKYNISLFDTNPNENLRLELIKLGIIKRYINFEKDSDKLFFAASFNGNLQTVTFLKENGANLNSATRTGFTALTYAAAKGHFNIVEYLIKNGANIDATDNLGMTALMYAVINNHLDAVNYLIKNGANICAIDKNDMTPLTYAKENDDIVKSLIDGINNRNN